MAYLLKDSLDDAAGQLTPVLELPAGEGIATVTGYLDEISRMLQGSRFARQPLAVQLAEQIREFKADAVTATMGP